VLTSEQFRENLSRVIQRIDIAAREAGRDPAQVTLVGVSKRKTATELQVAIDNGLEDIGENRAQEAREKFPQVTFKRVTRHFIGHLQSNKVKYLPGLFDAIQSVDSEHLAAKIATRFLDNPIPVMLQVNISGEESKAGVEPDQLTELTGACLKMEGILVEGFMTIGPLTTDREEIRAAFQRMFNLVQDQARQFPDRLKQPKLSMGMSNDFEIAIQEGASHIRVGTALFGARS